MSAAEEADELFARYLAERAAGQAGDFEALCAAHPEAAAGLRQLHKLWSQLEPLVGPEAEAAAASRQLLAGLESSASYDRREELGRGGMGVVYAAWDERLERRLAMKVLRAGEGSSVVEGRRLRRFLSEARITGQLSHPGIPAVHELGVDAQGRAWFTMPLVKGRTLGEVFDAVHAQEEGWSLPRALSVLQRVCETMAYAHSQRVLHRDLKPANVMVGPFGEAYVMDWGLARALGEDEGVSALDSDDLAAAPLATLEGDVVGTPHYMAPEQARGRLAELTAAADVYAAGAMLDHLLSGEPPYGASAGSGREVLERLLAAAPAPLAERAPRAPLELVAIAEKAMAREAQARYGSMRALADDLRAWLEGRVVRAYERGAWAELKKWVTRNRALAGSLGAAVLLALGGLSAVLWVQSNEQQKLLRLSHAQLLEELVAEADELWPAYPERARVLRDWVERARALVRWRPEHERTLSELEARAPTRPGRARGAADDIEARWLLELERALVAELRAFESEGGLLEQVSARLDFARSVRRRSLDEAAEAWERACAEIADPELCPLYAGLRIQPQLGLVPLERDARSGLWSFLVLQTGAAPQRESEGGWRVSAESGIVLVLIPGGAELEPYFLAAHELTRAQWARFAALPSDEWLLAGRSAEEGGRLPIDNVSWVAAARLLERLALRLPSVSEWRHAAAADEPDWWQPGDPVALKHTEVASNPPQFVDSLPPNPWGLHHLGGNVSEWVRWDADPEAAWSAWSEAGANPEQRFLNLGASSRLPADFVLSAYARPHEYDAQEQAANANRGLGLRAARSLRGEAP